MIFQRWITNFLFRDFETPGKKELLLFFVINQLAVKKKTSSSWRSGKHTRKLCYARAMLCLDIE